MADLTFCNNRHCENCAWAVNMHDQGTLCMRECVAIPVKGETAVHDGSICQWNKVGSVGTDHWMHKTTKSQKYILVSEFQREAEVGSIDTLHL